jgi:hypothetical protein
VAPAPVVIRSHVHALSPELLIFPLPAATPRVRCRPWHGSAPRLCAVARVRSCPGESDLPFLLCSFLVDCIGITLLLQLRSSSFVAAASCEVGEVVMVVSAAGAGASAAAYFFCLFTCFIPDRPPPSLFRGMSVHRGMSDRQQSWQRLLRTTHREGIAEGCVSSAPVIGERTRRNMFRSTHGVEVRRGRKALVFIVQKPRGLATCPSCPSRQRRAGGPGGARKVKMVNRQNQA